MLRRRPEPVVVVQEWVAAELGQRDPSRRRLGEHLLANSLVAQDHLDVAFTEVERNPDQTLGTFLVGWGVLKEEALAASLAEVHGLEIVDLGRVTPDPAVAMLVSSDTARALGVLPLRMDDDTIDVAVADPDDPRLDQVIPRQGTRRLRLFVSTPTAIERAINQSYRVLDGVSTHVSAFHDTGDRGDDQDAQFQVDVAPDAPVVQVVNLIMTQALRDRASDVHIEPLDDILRVRFRIDGALQDVLTLPLDIAPAVVSRLKIMADMNIVERRRPQDGQFAIEVDGRGLDVRVATAATINGEKAVLRLLDRSRAMYQLSDLGMPAYTAERYSKVVRSPFGMVICSGPTGSGKTTTLYATISEINRHELNVMTIEDPVEYVVRGINQMQTNDQAQVTFATGLKSILRQDPDVILVGEMRDVETARIAVQSALTGHFVLSSLHATDSVSALFRLLDMGIEPFLVASSTLAVVAQRLVRKICPHCRVTYKPSEDEIAFFRQGGGAADAVFTRGEGCNFCSQTGYHDRIGVYELLVLNEAVRSMLVNRVAPDELRRVAFPNRTHTLGGEAIRLVADGVSTIPEVIHNIYVQE